MARMIFINLSVFSYHMIVSFRPSIKRTLDGGIRVQSIFHGQSTPENFVTRFIGTSLLIVGDAKGKTGVNMIDLAKTVELGAGQIDHRKPWVLGNHEDGCLFGVDNMLSVWEEVLRRLTAAPEYSEVQNKEGVR